MFHAVCVSWLLFRAESIGQALEMFLSFFSTAWWHESLAPGLFQLSVLCTPLFLVQVLQTRTSDLLSPMRLSLVPRLLLYSIVLLMLVTLGNTGSRAFIYFQF